MEPITQTITEQRWTADRVAVGQSIELEIDRRLSQNGGNPLVLTICDKPRGRSGAQNRMLWALFGEIAAGFNKITPGHNYTKEDAHDYLLQACFGVQSKQIGKLEVYRQKETHKFSVAEAAEFITWALAWAAQAGIPVKMPSDYEQWARECR